MLTPGMGIGELLVVFVIMVLTLAFPVGILFLLYKIYVKLKDIEERLKKNSEASKREQI